MESFSIGKFFSGFNIFNWTKLAKLAFIALIASLCIGVHDKFTQPTSQVEHVDQQIIYSSPPSYPIGGCSLGRIKGQILWSK